MIVKIKQETDIPSDDFWIARHPAPMSTALPFAALCAWLDADMIIFRRVVLNALMADDIELFIL